MTSDHPLWLPDRPLLLASTSATRRRLLEEAGIPLETRRPNVDERAVETALTGPGDDDGMDASAIALQLARAKALAVSVLEPDRLVVGGDQTLALGKRRLHKPRDRDEALIQLRAMAAREHRLHAAFVLARHGHILAEAVDTARLSVRAYDDAFLARYLAVAGESVCESVGAYRLEGPGATLFDSVDGDYFTILGLPLMPLLAALRAEGALAG